MNCMMMLGFQDLRHRVIPSHHPFLDGIFPNKNHTAIGGTPFMETPIFADISTCLQLVYQGECSSCVWLGYGRLHRSFVWLYICPDFVH